MYELAWLKMKINGKIIKDNVFPIHMLSQKVQQEFEDGQRRIAAAVPSIELAQVEMNVLYKTDADFAVKFEGPDYIVDKIIAAIEE